MTTLTDRYLSAVGVLLPGEGRDDILAELRDFILNKREEKEAALRRPLSESEESDLLRDFGHPIRVAGRYGPQRYLVGPDLFPLYWLAVRLVIAIAVISGLIAGVVRLVSGAHGVGEIVGLVFGQAFNGALTAIGVVTVGAWAIQRWNVGMTFLDHWNPRELPTAPKLRTETRFDAFASIVSGAVFLLWWTGWLGFGEPEIHTRSGAVFRWALAPVWGDVYLPVILVTLARTGLSAVRLALGRQATAASLAFEAVVHLAGLGLLVFLLLNGPWLVVYGDVPAKLGAAMPSVNLGLRISLIVMVVLSVGALIMDAWRFSRLGKG